MSKNQNLFKFNTPKTGESFEKLLEHKNVKIFKIVSSDEVDSKTYIQNEDEWVVLLRGEATLELDGEILNLKEGDFLFIPAKTPHKILNTKRGTLWLAVHIF